VLKLSDDVRYIKGVGEARMKLYNKLGIFTVEDLLLHTPRGYIDLSQDCSAASAPFGERAAIRASVVHKSPQTRIRKGLSIFKVLATDGVSDLKLTFFNAKYTVDSLEVGKEYIFYGRAEGTLYVRTMDSPQVFPSASGQKMVPVYPLTAGLSSKMTAANIKNALDALGELPDTLGEDFRRRYSLVSFDRAVRGIHSPQSAQDYLAGRRRLAFDELFCLMLGFAKMKSGREVKQITPFSRCGMGEFYRSLPFTLTGAQARAIEDALTDMCSGHPMNRLVQGDVGSGKTMVAAACCYFAHKNGKVSAVMAPTEILARQHYENLSPLLENLGMRTALLTGSTPAAQKRAIKKSLAAGETDLVIGTHALLTDDCAIGRLGLVVTDEQHRFGVGQRSALKGKAQDTHVLVMSATPIPRTLALIIYGDMELSVIDELPRGRQKTETYLIDGSKRERAFGYIRKHLDMGLQGFIVCPLIEHGEDETDAVNALTAAEDYFSQLAQGAFSDYRLGLLHGKMKAALKEETMRRFVSGEIQLLVSTTVIEVGIDVPNAVIMLVENAERFGLSQLHQLRGRIGRGKEKGTCILLSDAGSQETRTRLKTLCASSDGFRIAQEDLKLRGPGDFFGMRQHGLPQLRNADLASDSELLESTRSAADEMMREDPDLEGHPLLAEKVKSMVGKMVL